MKQRGSTICRKALIKKYQLYLPTEAELQAEIVREMQIIAIEQGLKNE
jgi:hypothetical protein